MLSPDSMGCAVQHIIRLGTCVSCCGLLLQASSPDEEALVQGAAYLGYELLARTTDFVRVRVHGAVHTYDILATLEFNSDRKRMSIIVRGPDGKITLMCKGADTMILSRLKDKDSEEVQIVQQHLVSTARPFVVQKASFSEHRA